MNNTEDKKCKVCGERTRIAFNINLSATTICEDCANAITIQQVKWLMDNSKLTTNNQ